MSVASDILKGFAVFVDGRGYAGEVQELQLPKLSLTTEDFRAAGMDAPVGIETGMEKLECTMTTPKQCADLLSLFGLTTGTDTQLTARGSLESFDGTVTPVVVQLRGRLRSIEPAAWKSGEVGASTYTFDLTYYKREQGGRVLHEIDVINMVRIVNGMDQLAARRSALGM
ncbi:phage major tail tube protein [Desulfovibrio subterraneus]|uniref:Bacteriophage protein n=1 Tax=Desulfovibrio subterraneus TaxID=2718620 RepID=A0A7J0BLJ0_9BACT|nr:phage major tail tube protein [Desulfovibrio subterraneus]GFM34025.1 bacteriophage protein [Desulfovibrio subterraneus]